MYVARSCSAGLFLALIGPCLAFSAPVEPIQLDDVPQPLATRRSSEETDRLEALAHFSAARQLERQGRDAESLRRYQRAARYDPDSVTVVSKAVSIAAALKRLDEAARYAARLPGIEKVDPSVLQRIGSHQASKGDLELSIAVHQKSLAAYAAQGHKPAETLQQIALGQLCYVDQRYAEAADYFAAAMAALKEPEKHQINRAVRDLLVGKQGRTYNLIGEAFLLAGRPDEAAYAYEEANRLDPNEAILAYHRARVHDARDEPSKALQQLEKFFEHDETSEGMAPYRLLAQLLEKLDRPDELLQQLEQLHQEKPENWPLTYALAEQYLDLQQYDQAEPLYTGLLTDSPSGVAYRALVAIHAATGELDKLTDTLALARSKGVAPDSLGEDGRPLAANKDLTARILEAASTRQQDSPASFDIEHYRALAALALDAEDLDTAKRFFNLALKSDPDRAAEVLLTWGGGLLAVERYREAANLFRRGIRDKALPEDDPSFHYYRAAALELNDQTEAAVADAKTAIKLGKDDARYRVRLAWIYLHDEQEEKARAAYQSLLDDFREDHSSGQVRQIVREARLILSNFHVEAGELDQAVQLLEGLLDEFPDDVSALNDLGYLWADDNVRLPRSLAMLEYVVEQSPENGAYRDSLGWVLYRLERYKEAAEQLEKAVELEPDAVILDHLGDAYQAQEQRKKAVEAWRRALELYREQEKPLEATAIEKKIDPGP